MLRLLYENSVPGFAFVAEEKKLLSQFVLAKDSASLNTIPVCIVRRSRTVISDVRSLSITLILSSKISAARSESESLPSSISIPMAMDVMLLHAENVIFGTVIS